MNKNTSKGKVDNGLRDRAKGALWGLLVGDALGNPLQFGPARPDGNLLTEMEAGGVFRTPPGHWTDDGSMELCIIDSYVRKGGFDLRDIADTFLKWLNEGYLSSLDHAFDQGISTSNSLYKYERTGSLVNGHEGAQGNGSLMRHAPVTFIAEAAGDETIVEAVSDITHASNAVRRCVRTLHKALVSHAYKHERTDALGRYVLKDENDNLVFAPRREISNSGHAEGALDSALWAFHSTGSFEDCLVAAVNNGNDADTVGAIAGQLAGAYYGFSAIPERWLAKMKTRKFLDDLIEKFLDLVLQ